MAGPSLYPRCHKCFIGFRDFGERTGSKRYESHIELEHTFQCDKCGIKFISKHQLKYHDRMLHELPCDVCRSACEFKCLKDFVPIKQDIYWVRDSQIDYIKSLERQLDNKSMRLEISDEDLRKKLQDAVFKLDIGINHENLGELCELVYLPRCSNLKESQDPYIGETLEWTRNEEYIISLERQVDDVCSAPIYECDVSPTCDAMFLSISKQKYHRNEHRVSRHNTAKTTVGHKPGSPDLNDIFSYTHEPQQGNNKGENKQMTLGITNQLEDRKGNTVQFDRPEVHVGKAHEALQKAISNHLEGRDSYYIYMDEDCIEILEPVRPAGRVAPSSQNSQNLGYTHGQLKYEGATLEIQDTINKTVVEGNVE